MTKAGFALGTPYYMAPEQVLGEQVAEPADVYAFGIMLFEMFTGAKPITGETVERLFYQILNEPVNIEPMRQAGVPEPWFNSSLGPPRKRKKTGPRTSLRSAPSSKALIQQFEPRSVTAEHAAADRRSARIERQVGRAVLLLVLRSLHRGRSRLHQEPEDRNRASADAEYGNRPDGARSGWSIPAGERERSRLWPPSISTRRKSRTRSTRSSARRRTVRCRRNFPKDRPDDPVVNVTIADATALCEMGGQAPADRRWNGKRPRVARTGKPGRGATRTKPKFANVSDNPNFPDTS